MKKSQFQTIMQTKATDSLQNKLTAVFGAELTRQMTSLPGSLSKSTDFCRVSNFDHQKKVPKLSTENAINFFGLADKDDAEGLAEKAIECAQSFKFEGYITKNNGAGRSSSDRQFFYINKRPVDMPFLARILNSGQALA